MLHEVGMFEWFASGVSRGLVTCELNVFLSGKAGTVDQRPDNNPLEQSTCEALASAADFPISFLTESMH